MKKKLLTRGLSGFPIGIAIGYALTILSSLIWGNWLYCPCPAEFISLMGNEINAVI